MDEEIAIAAAAAACLPPGYYEYGGSDVSMGKYCFQKVGNTVFLSLF